MQEEIKRNIKSKYMGVYVCVSIVYINVILILCWIQPIYRIKIHDNNTDIEMVISYVLISLYFLIYSWTTEK